VWRRIERPRLRGGYVIELTNEARKTHSFEITVSPDGRVVAEDNPNLEALIELLSNLPFKLLYISHDREVNSTDSRLSKIVEEDDLFLDPRLGTSRRRRIVSIDKFSIPYIANAVQDDVRRQLLERANFAQENINSIYLTIARQVGLAEGRPASLDETLNKINDIERRYPLYQRIRALSPIPFDSFREVIKKARETQQGSVVAVLTPFLDGTLARMENISRMVVSLNSFLDEMNTYFSHKNIEFNVIQGFSVKDAGEQKVEMDWLSSGERQLLFIFLSVLLMKNSPALILIDEPELSLNMKWQRKIVSSLSNLAGDSEVSFLFATHAFEILAKFESNVVDLNLSKAR
jgi:AAA domain, putative AbiEii toxin, Type IV TA system